MPTNAGNVLGRFIAMRRMELGLQQQELAERLNRAKSIVSEWENDRRPIPEDMLEDIARALEMNSPIRLYQLAGKLVDFPGVEITRLFENASCEDIQILTNVARSYLEAKGKR